MPPSPTPPEQRGYADLQGGYQLPVPLRSRRLLLVAPLAIAIALTAWVGPAAAPPFKPNAKLPQVVDRYQQLKKHGTPVAMIVRPTALRATPGGRVLTRLGKLTEWRSPRALPAVGRRGPWLRVLATELPNGATGWIPVDSVQLLENPWSVRADLSKRRVTVRRAGRVVRRFTVAVGAPETPTPVGRYSVTDKLQLTGGSSAYGCCALALSGHQPNLRQGWRGGDRLAIHGTRMLQSLGHAASLGCLRATDRDARWVIDHLFLGTVVDIRR